jgi:predicted NUDIX family phosphoesterase
MLERPNWQVPGFVSVKTDLLTTCRWLEDAGIWLGPRRSLEEDPSFRQIIPYVILRKRDSLGVERYLGYRRGAEIEEARLRGVLSFGWGGHIDLPDVCCNGCRIDLYRTLKNAVAREMFEEVGMVIAEDALELRGLIIDDSTEVGRVHLGVLLIAEPTGQVVSKEDSQLDLQWLTIEEAQAAEGEREGWTAICIEHLAATPKLSCS